MPDTRYQIPFTTKESRISFHSNDFPVDELRCEKTYNLLLITYYLPWLNESYISSQDSLGAKY